LTPLTEPYLLTGAGDIIRVYDVSSLDEPELIGQVDAHWHDVTALRLWARRTFGDCEDGRARVEPWVISASLDGTIRKWRLSGMCSFYVSVYNMTSQDTFLFADLLNPSPVAETKAHLESPPTKVHSEFNMTEEEERELAELLD
jgi:hypothetical protein